MVYDATLIVAPNKDQVPSFLNAKIVEYCEKALLERGVFTIALSGGSLPSFLSSVKDAFDEKGVDPKFDSWNVILADERCVVSTDPDSNLGALQKEFFAHVSIPTSQIFGINEDLLTVSTAAVAEDYEPTVRKVLDLSGGQLDLAVLGFGPDGHTCSLFPGHALLQETTKWVAPIEDSPKPPPCRITLTFPVLNSLTRNVIFCGAGESKSPILQAVFASVTKTSESETYGVTMSDPAPYPCGMVLPNSEGVENSLTWVVDADALAGVAISE